MPEVTPVSPEQLRSRALSPPEQPSASGWLAVACRRAAASRSIAVRTAGPARVGTQAGHAAIGIEQIERHPARAPVLARDVAALAAHQLGAAVEQPPLVNTWEPDARGDFPSAVVEAVDPDSVGIDPLAHL